MPQMFLQNKVLRRRSAVMIVAQKRVGIFAGSFDPIHDGHLEAALLCVKCIELSKVFFLVEPRPWGSKDPIGVAHRREMVDLAIDKYPQLDQIKLEDNQFSISDTLRKLEKQFPDQELYFIFGADIFIKMNKTTWPNLEQLFEHYIVVIERNEITEQQISEHARELGIAIAILPSEHLKHSSTDVRMQPHKKSIWVSEKVSQYIDDNNLYREN